MHHSLFIHIPIEGHIGCFQVLAVMTKVAMAPHSSTLAWEIPWTEEPRRLQSMGSLRVDTTERLHFHFSLSCIGEGNGNPLQCSWLETPKDGRAWWAVILVSQSWIWLKQLSSSSSWITFHCLDAPQFVYSYTYWRTYWLFPSFGSYD